MQYKKIFWLEDCPDGLIKRYLKSHPETLESFKDVVQRITFTASEERAKQILKEQKFDFYIFDSNVGAYYSHLLEESISENLSNILSGNFSSQRRKIHKWEKARILSQDSNHYFAQVCLERQDISSKMVVCSDSPFAAELAFQLNVPFAYKSKPNSYCKEIIRQKINDPQLVEETRNFQFKTIRPVSELNDWSIYYDNDLFEKILK